ncbi:MAG: BrnT family toxin [Gemmobacter sp.]
MKVTFDPLKRAATLADRGLDMADVEEVFSLPHVTFADERKSYPEPRWVTVGWLWGRMVVMAWTLRDDTRRVISLRKANEREQARHGSSLGP